MGLTRRNQLLAKVETTEGTPATLTTAEFIDAKDLARTIAQDIEDDVAASASLSEDLGVVGRGSMGVTFRTRHYGLNGTHGLVASPPGVTGLAPLDDALLRGCGLRSSLVPYYRVTALGNPTVATWPGLVVKDAALNEAVLAVPMVANGGAQRMYVIAAEPGFPSGTTITVQMTGNPTLTLAETGIDGYAFAYTPDSTPTAIVLIGAWTGNAPIVGDVVTNRLDGVNAARGLVVDIQAGYVEIEPLLPGRAFLAAEVMKGTDPARLGESTVAGGGQTLNRVPSLTMGANIGGHTYTGVGMRGNLTLNLEAGKIALADYDFSGSRYSSASAAPLDGVASVSASGLPRWQNAWAHVDGYEVPLSNSSITLGNTVSLIADAHGTQGVRGSAITARQASITADFDRVNNAIYNFDTRIGNATPISFFSMWGTQNASSLAVAVWAPRCQLYSISDGDREGQLTAQVTLRPKRRTGSGDDEIYFIFGIGK